VIHTGEALRRDARVRATGRDRDASRLQRATTSASDGACTTIVEVRTTSAHSRSESRSGATFMSTSRRSQGSGSMAASVMRPRGGKAARRSMYGRALLKLQ
jgi:hypothetical protein